MRRIAGLGALALVAGAMVSGMGCSRAGEGGDDEDTGVAQVAISQVPLDGSVGCIAVTATGTHSKTKSVDVASGQSTVIGMNGLPVGTVSFLGNAYQGPCAAVTPASAPTWISDAVLASVSNVQPVMVHLSMRRSGQAGVDVDFQDEPSCRADGAPCLSAAECCSQACVAGACSSSPPVCGPGLVSCNGGCVDLTSDPSNCGACGLPCPGGFACQFGACMPASSCVDGVKNGMETSIDCGGPACPACATGLGCAANVDCVSGYCLNNVCAQQAQCQTALDCPGVDTDCQARTCTAGVCGMIFAAAGTPVSTQTPGDCLVTECDGAGGIYVTPDNTDVPDDNNQCTTDACTPGGPSHVPAPAGTACYQNGGTMCNGNGICI